MNSPQTLLITLKGPMQSWGFRSRFDDRDTSLEPTRSGVIGLICAAMGIARGEGISKFDIIRMGVRIDKEGRVERDYQTAQNVVRADGSSGSDVVSQRYYLADASYTVGLESTDVDLLTEIAEALRNPKWTLFLGRKSNPLSVPPVKPDDSIIPKTLEELLLKCSSGMRVVIEPSHENQGSRIQNDWPICFEDRQFKPRVVRTTFSEGE